MNKNLEHFLIFFILAALISLIYYYFGDFWNLMSSDSFLNKYLVSPVENFLYSMFPKETIIGIFVIIGLILTIIFIFLAIYELFKFLKFVQKK